MNDHDKELNEFASELARSTQVKAPVALRNQLRASLLAAPVVHERRSRLVWPNVFALRPVIAAVLVLALLAAGGGSAAASSLPGDPAFGLKRAVEELQVALARDDAARLDVLVMQADRRLADLGTASSTRPAALAAATNEYRSAVSRIDTALAAVLAQPAEANRDAAIADASAASLEHIATLEALASRLPVAGQQGVQRAIEAQQTIHGKSEKVPSATPGLATPTATPNAQRGGRPSGAPSASPSALPSGAPSPSAPPGRRPPNGVPGRQ